MQLELNNGNLKETMEFRSLLGAFAKLRKATKLRHGRPSAPMEQFGFHWKD